MKCVATIKIGQNLIDIPIDQNEINDLQKIVLRLYENKEKFGEFVTALRNRGYDTIDFKLTYDSLKGVVGNLSLRLAVTKFSNPNLDIFLRLGDIMDENNILITHKIFGTGSALLYHKGTFKLLLSTSNYESRNEVVKSNVKKILDSFIILNWIKSVITSEDSELKSETINQINSVIHNFEKNERKSYRSKEIAEMLNKLTGENKYLTFLAYYYGDEEFKKSVPKKFKNTFDDFISKNYTLVSPGSIINENTEEGRKLKSILTDDYKIIKKDLKEKNISIDDLINLILKFNESLTNIYLNIDYDAGEYIKLKTLGYSRDVREMRELIGPEFYGEDTNPKWTYRGYDIVEIDGKYFLGKHAIIHSREMLDLNVGAIKRIRSVSDINTAISKRLNEVKKTDNGKFKGDWILTSSYWNRILVSNNNLTTLKTTKSDKLKKGAKLKIMSFDKVIFNHNIEDLSRWKPKELKNILLYYGNLVYNIEAYLKSLSILDFFRDNEQILKYKEILDSTDKAEAFFLRTYDIILDNIENGKIANKAATLFDIDKETRWSIIDQVLEELSNEVYNFYDVVSDPDEDGNVEIVKVELTQPNYKFPKYNIKSDLIAVADHLEKHFNVKCNIVNDLEVLEGIGPKKIKVDKKAKAFILNGEIYINIDRADAGDVLHEYAHLALGIMKADPDTNKKYYDLVSLVTNLPDYKDRILKYRDSKDFRSEIDLLEEIFVTIFGEYFGHKIMLNYYTDPTLDLVLSGFKDEFQDLLIKAFALGDTAKLLFLELLSTTSILDALSSFGTLLWNKDNYEISKEVQDKTIVSRKTSNYISSLIQEGTKEEPKNSYLKEDCK